MIAITTFPDKKNRLDFIALIVVSVKLEVCLKNALNITDAKYFNIIKSINYNKLAYKISLNIWKDNM